MENFIAYLNTIHRLSEGCQQYLMATIKPRTLEPREFLLTAGDTSRELCFITSGLVRSFEWDDDREICNWFTREGDFVISPYSFFYQTPGRENIQALKRTTLYYMKNEDLQHAYLTYLEFNIVRAKLLEKYYCLETEKLYIQKLASVQRRYQYLMEHYPWMIQTVSSKNIAAYLGSSEQQLSRIKRKLLEVPGKGR